MHNLDPLLSPREAAELLSCSRRTVYGWVESGRLPAVRIGMAKNSPLRIPVTALTDQLSLAGPKENRTDE